MASQRPPSGLARPVSRSGSGRPPTAVRPPPTAIRVATGMVPGTAGRGLPVSVPGLLSAQIKVADRPVTQQGLSGMKTGVKGPQRQILDKSYYLGLLRSKINELSTENSKLHKEIDNFHQENSVYLSYEKKAEGLAAEIKDFQGQLADYNMLVDNLNTHTDMEEMINDYNTLKAQNNQKAESIDNIFTERREKEEAIQAVEEDMARERSVAEELVQSMASARQEQYYTMTANNQQLLQELSVLQEELDLLQTRREDYEAELSHSQTKQQMVLLHEHLSELQQRRDALEAEHKNMGSPQEERERLLRQVKEDNQEIASMERQLSETRERSRQLTDELQQMEQDSEDAQGESRHKYNQLKKKEEEVNSFLESFEDQKLQQVKKQQQIQQNVLSLLEQCSRNMGRLQQVDFVTAGELKNIQEVLLSKETEVNQSESTTKSLHTEYMRLVQDLEKVQQLEGKFSSELETRRQQLLQMETELKTYRDLEELKRNAHTKKRSLEEQRVSLSQRRESFKELLNDMKNKYENLKKNLEENETHTQLWNLEKKWQHLEQNNFTMKDFIASKSQESDFSPVAQRVTQKVSEYNLLLIQALQNH
ncbi:unnamed protein product [Knipowitschia caucasica]